MDPRYPNEKLLYLQNVRRTKREGMITPEARNIFGGVNITQESSNKVAKKKTPGVHVRFKIRDYRIYLGRNMKAKLPGFVPDSKTVRFYAQIICTSEEAPHYYLNLYFLRPDSEKMDNYFYPDQRLGASFLPYEQYTWYLDILRNEEPVYGYLNSSRPSGNGISTSQEPVGEGEGS